MKYCYTDGDCKSFLLDTLPNVTSYADCCNNGGSGWGLFHSECMACSDVTMALDDDLVTGLDTPVGQCKKRK